MGGPSVSRRTFRFHLCSPLEEPSMEHRSESEPSVAARSETWQTLFECHGPALRRLVLRFSSNLPALPEDREELLQEVYCRLLQRCSAEKLAGLSGRARGNYLKRVVRSVVTDWVRERLAKKRRIDRCVRITETQVLNSIPDTRVDLERALLSRERYQRAIGSWSELLAGRNQDRDLEILSLAWLEGWNSQEISSRLGRRLLPSSVDTLLSRSRRRLRERGWTAEALSPG